MDTTTSSIEDLVCQTCGDKGFTNAFVYCVKCLGSVIHRYCLNVIPKSFDEFVDWVCEDCKQPLPCPSTSHKSQSHKGKSPQVKTKKRKNKSKKKKKKARLGVNSSFKDLPVLALEAPVKGEDKKKRDESLSGVKSNENKTAELSCCDSSCTDENLKNKADIQQPKTTPEKFHSFQNQKPEAETAKEMHNEEEIRVDKSDADADATQSNSTGGFENNAAEYIPYEPANPIPDPVWSGSFDITQTDNNNNNNVFEGFVGHLSTKACDRVCQEVNALPSLLSLKMQSKAAVWPKGFVDSQPSDEDIALFFFPGDTKNEEYFEDLVSDMIRQQLAMKTPAKDADLLIFTSRDLPRPFWRFQGKNYLWGVFRRKQEDLSVSNNSEKEILTKVKLFNSQSPQSPLCNYR